MTLLILLLDGLSISEIIFITENWLTQLNKLKQYPPKICMSKFITANSGSLFATNHGLSINKSNTITTAVYKTIIDDIRVAQDKAVYFLGIEPMKLIRKAAAQKHIAN